MRKLINKRGEGYIDVVVSVLVCTMIMVLALNVFNFLTLKQDMDYFSKEMLEVAISEGNIKGNKIQSRYTELCSDTGLTPTYCWKPDYYNSGTGAVQLGETITIIIYYNTYLKGFGAIKIPITLTSTQSGLSRKYWK